MVRLPIITITLYYDRNDLRFKKIVRPKTKRQAAYAVKQPAQAYGVFVNYGKGLYNEGLYYSRSEAKFALDAFMEDSLLLDIKTF